jgi:type VI secretion system protein ImpE
MTAKQLLDAGQLLEAVQALTLEVKAKPAHTASRVFLFELLCFAGDFERASKQLDVIAAQGSGLDNEIAIQAYRDLLAAERLRQQVFHGGALPMFFLEPPAYINDYVMLVKQVVSAPAAAVAALPNAEALSPSISGNLGARQFASFRDADDRLAPVLEVFHGSKYLWLPLEQIRRLQVTPPKFLRNTLWAHATIEVREGSVGDVFLPTLYVNTSTHPNDHVRLGRMTEWTTVEDQLVCGVGQRVFLMDDEEVSLLELRDVQFAETPATVTAS